ncbi:MAG: 16S rRNA (cytidine(1402)-2'-O)-methyltransferase, partial [Terriglobales bacterium]
ARAGERRRQLEPLRTLAASAVFYEAPHRLLATLADMEEILGAERPLVVARELTKRFEQLLRGTVGSARAYFAETAPRGEFTLILGPGSPQAAPAAAAEQPEAAMSRDELKAWARARGLSRSEAYRRWQQLRGKMKS